MCDYVGMDQRMSWLIRSRKLKLVYTDIILSKIKTLRDVRCNLGCSSGGYKLGRVRIALGSSLVWIENYLT